MASQIDSSVNSVIDKLSLTSIGPTSILNYAGKGFKLNKEYDAETQVIIADLNKCNDVKALCLQGNTLGVEAAKAIAKALEGHPEFQRALWSDMFTGRLKTEIPEALRYLGSAIMLSGAQLVELDLSDNAFGPNGMKGLTELLKSSSCFSLEILKLHNNGLGTTGGKMLAKSLMECHEASVKAGKPLALKVFISGRGRLENEGSQALAEVFKVMGSLEEVEMPQNGINFEGIHALSEAFAKNPNLRHINLNDNTFTAKGADSMSKALPHLKKLEIMNFGDCLVRTAGAKFIAKSLKGLQCLKDVNLSFNEITKTGAEAIIYAIADKNNLARLDLDGNNFGEEGVEVVNEVIRKVDKDDIFVPIEDDQGSDESGDEWPDDEQQEDEDDDDDSVEIEDPELTVTGKALTPISSADKKFVGEFLQFPSATKLLQISANHAFLDRFQECRDNVEEVLTMFMKISSVVTRDEEKTRTKACHCIDRILKTYFESKKNDTNQVSLFSNAMLVHLGLLKSEDKKFVPVAPVSGPLLTLQHVVQQSYFPQKTRDILTVFLGKSNEALAKYKDLQHHLLQVLYQF